MPKSLTWCEIGPLKLASTEGDPDCENWIITRGANTRGLMKLDDGRKICIDYEDAGLKPLGVAAGDYIYVGINELFIGYDRNLLSGSFRYLMPAVFHEIVSIDSELILRDEIGFVGLTLDGANLWEHLTRDIVLNYKFDGRMIYGTTLECQEFCFAVPSRSG